jgi:hypothetical protein
MATLLSNAPAEPAILFAECVDDLLLEARNFLDGEPITNEQQAEAVSSLLNRLRRVSKDADEARKVEKQPHLDASRAVDGKWKPIADKADLAVTTCKQALAPYLKAIEEENQRQAEAARKEADRLAEIARTAHQGASGNLQASEDAERLLRAAKAAEKDAARAGRAKAHATGGERAVGLRTYYTAEVIDPLAFGKWAWEHCHSEYLQFLEELAEREARRGSKGIPGLKITEDRRAV